MPTRRPITMSDVSGSPDAIMKPTKALMMPEMSAQPQPSAGLSSNASTIWNAPLDDEDHGDEESQHDDADLGVPQEERPGPDGEKAQQQGSEEGPRAFDAERANEHDDAREEQDGANEEVDRKGRDERKDHR